MLKQPTNKFQDKVYPILSDCDSLTEKEQRIENLVTFKNVITLKLYKVKFRIWQLLSK